MRAIVLLIAALSGCASFEHRQVELTEGVSLKAERGRLVLRIEL